ncbi:MAG TPA: hypothetical protein VHW00_20915 [Thermoanaerobaculia bacterium]|nr:hypothetical protein [Thermoanaerobaculia bacterium]
MVLSFTTLSAELIVSAPRDVTLPRYSVSAYDEVGPHIASNGQSFLAVWQSDLAVRMARISATGEVQLPPDELALGLDPDLAFGGGRYLVVWRGAFALNGAFVDENGISEPFAIGPIPLGRPMIAFNGATFLVLWRADHQAYEGSFVSTGGSVSPRVRVPVMNVARQHKLVAVGRNFHLAVAAGGRVSLVPVTANGAGNPIPVARASGFAELEAGTAGDEVVLAWKTGNRIEWVTVDGADVGIVQSFDAGSASLHPIISGSRDALLVYSDEAHTYARRAAPGAEPYELPLPSFANGISDAACNGSTLAVVFENLGFERDAYGLVLDGVRGAIPLDMRLTEQFGGDISSGGSMALAVWNEWRNGSDRAIVASRIDAAGRSLDPLGIDLLPGTGLPRVAWNGTEWLVVVSDLVNERFTALRVSSAGKILDPTPIELPAKWPGAHAVEWDGEQWLVAYFEYDYFHTNTPFALYATRIAADGTTSSRVKLAEVTAPVALDLATSPQTALVVWNSARGVEGLLVAKSQPPIPFRLSNPYGLAPSVVWNGQSYVVAFPNAQAHTVEWHLVNENGIAHIPAAVPPIPLTASAYGVTVTATIFEGRTLLTWNDAGPPSPGFAALLESDGTILEPRTAIGAEKAYLPIISSGSFLLQQGGTATADDHAKVIVRTIRRR